MSVARPLSYVYYQQTDCGKPFTPLFGNWGFEPMDEFSGN